MTRKIAILAAGIFFLGDSVSAQDTLIELRLQFASAKTDGVSSDEFVRLSERALVLTNAAGSRGKFWNLIGFLAELCEAGPYDAVAAVRASALGVPQTKSRSNIVPPSDNASKPRANSDNWTVAGHRMSA